MTAAQKSIDTALPRTGGEATDMLDLMLRLADLLSHETELLRAGRVRDIAGLQIEKLRLTTQYDRAIKALAAAGMTVQSLPPPLRAQIVAAGTRLTQMIAENERALRIGSAATRRILDMLVESIKAKRATVTRYTSRLATTRHGPMLAMAIDRRL
jgi:hypothetical protein